MYSDINPVGWFEIPVSDMQRAKAFYEKVFELELSLNQMGPAEMAWFPMHHEKNGAPGTLIKAEGYAPSNTGTVVYFQQVDIGAACGRIEEAGGKVLQPKMSIGEHGFVAHFEDTEGNRLALHSRT